jgi:vitamin B12 transporter
MLLAIVFAAALAALGVPALTVVDDGGLPVAGANVVFVDASGARDAETTNAAGVAGARDGFDAVRAQVSARGFAAQNVTLKAGIAGQRVVLVRSLPIVGRVTVATGSSASLHNLPVPASAMDSVAIAGQPAMAADAVLSQLAGNDHVRSNSAFTNYGQLRASFSGAGNDRGVVLVDGLPAQDGFGGQIDWLAYPPATIERAELLLGAGSPLYGSGGVGGVLNLTTFGPQADSTAPADGRFTVGSGTNAQQDDALLFRGALGHAFTASVSTTKQRLSYLDLPPGYAAPIDTPAVATSQATTMRVRYDGGATSVEASALAATDGQQEGRPSYAFDRTMQQEALVVTHAVGNMAASVTTYARDAYVVNLADQFPTAPGLLRYTQDVPTFESGLSLNLIDQGAHGTLQLRADTRYVRGTSTQFDSTGALQVQGSGDQVAQGIALQGTLRAGRFEALGGARVDDVRFENGITIGSNPNPSVPGLLTTYLPPSDTGAVSPRVALRYDLSSHVALRVSDGAGFRAPFLNELLRGYQIGKVVFAPNPHLVPERSATVGAGIDLLGGRDRLSLDVSSTRVHNAIDFVTISSTLQKRENVDRTQTDATTLTYARSLGPCTRLRVFGTEQYARITAGVAGTLGNRLQYVPDHLAGLGIDAGGARLSFSVDGSYVGQTYADDLNQEPLGAALLFDAQSTLALNGGASLALGVINATRQQYLSSIDRFGPPLTVGVKLTVPLRAHESARSLCAAT